MRILIDYVRLSGGAFKPGRRIVYERVPDYWARDLSTRRGLYNFDRWIVDYYRDTNAKAQAFEAGLSDMVVEYNPGRLENPSEMVDALMRYARPQQITYDGELVSIDRDRILSAPDDILLYFSATS